MKIALSSLDQSWKNKVENRIKCEQHCVVANENNAQMIVFPEMTLSGFCMDAEELAEPIENSESVALFQELACKYNLYILFGYIVENEGFYNRAVIINPKGRSILHYDKIHLFSPADEDKTFMAGDDLSVVKIADLRIGLSICYDLRFPELYSALAHSCDLVINIANWPAKRVVHWDTLLRARAIENQYFTLGVNRTGIDGNKVSYCKSSVCYHPSGDMLLMKNLCDNLDLIDFNMSSLVSYRRDFSTLESRRIDLYSNFKR